jgi:hypothetical protein
MNPKPTLVQRNAMLLFIALTYLLSWWTVPFLHGGLFPYGPTLAAVIVLAATEGRAGLAAWWRRVTHWRVSGVWYVIAPGIIIAYSLGGLGLNLLFGATLQPVNWRGLLQGIISILLVGGLWEEPGWTGYALPTLQARYAERSAGLLIATALLGILRASWHLPLAIYGTIPWYDVVFFEVAFQFLIAWLYNRTKGSVPVVMLFHLTSNLVGIYLHALFTGADWARNYLLFVVLAILLTVAIVRRAGERLGQEPKDAGAVI